MSKRGSGQALISSFFAKRSRPSTAASPTGSAPGSGAADEAASPAAAAHGGGDEMAATEAPTPASPWKPSYREDAGRRERVKAALDAAARGADDEDDAGASEAASGVNSAGGGTSLTPLERQIAELQGAWGPGMLLVIEVGYKFRIFGADAVDAAKVLGLVAWQDKSFMTCSFPTTRLGVHVRRLVAAGRRVGVVRQTETAALKKAGKSASSKKSGTFTRALSRAFSPATMLDDLDAELFKPPPSGGGAAKKDWGDYDDEDDGETIDDDDDDDALIEESDAERWLFACSARAGRLGVVAVELRSARCVLDSFDEGDASSLAEALSQTPPSEALLGASVPEALRREIQRATEVQRPSRSQVVVDDDDDDNKSSSKPPHQTEDDDDDHYRAARLNTATADVDLATSAALNAVRTFLRASGVESALDAAAASSLSVNKRVLGGPPPPPDDDHRGLASASADDDDDDDDDDDGNRVPAERRRVMAVDALTLKDLEVLRASDGTERGSILRVLARGAKTRGGVDVLRDWLRAPLAESAAIRKRQRAVLDLGAPSGPPRCVEALSDLLDERAPAATMARSLEKPLAALAARRVGPKRMGELLRGAKRLAEAVPEVWPPPPPPPPPHEGGGLPPLAPVLVETLEDAALERAAVLGGVRRHLEGSLCAEACADDDAGLALMRIVDEFEGLKRAVAATAGVTRALDDELRRVRGLVKKPQLEWKSINASSTSKIEFMVELSVKERPPEATWVVVSQTKACKRYHTPAAGRLAVALDVARDEQALAAKEAWADFVARVDRDLGPALRRMVRALHRFDAFRALAALTHEPGWHLPEIRPDDAGPARATLRAFAHPTLPVATTVEDERMMMMTEDMYAVLVTNDVDVAAPKCICLTGPNMGGKSSTARAIALALILAQVGGPIFAAEGSSICPFDAVFTRMGASDDLAAGRSTFLCELQRAAYAVNHATARSFVILDELGRGTSTADGVAIAGAVLDHLVTQVRCATVFITHYHEVATAAAADHKADGLVTNAHMAFERVPRPNHPGSATSANDDDDIIMLYKLQAGLAPESFGLHAARIAGMPGEVLDLARDYIARHPE